MIKSYNVEKLYDFFGNLFSIAFNSKMSFSALESALSHSVMINQLESNDDSFLLDNRYRYLLIKQTINVSEQEILKMSNKIIIEARWIAEAYIKLFFRFSKSFEFLFLFLPIPKLLSMFPVYHEMDWQHLYTYFSKLTSNKTILTALIKKRQLTIPRLSLLTGISINTLMKYANKNSYLYGAGFDNITVLSEVLRVKPNIFIKKLSIYTDTSIYQFDKTDPIYRSYLGLIYVSYINARINHKKWKYNQEKNMFYNENENVYVRWVDFVTPELHTTGQNQRLFETIKNLSNKIKSKEEVTLIIFDYNQNDEKYEIKKYSNFVSDFKDVYVINQHYIFNFKKSFKIYEINNFYHEKFIRLAKQYTQTVRHGNNILE